MSYNFTAIEQKWQQYWLEHKSFRALDPSEAGKMPKAYVLDMFPYPSGAGLHVGHPEGYTATDIVSRYLRMKGHNVLHPIGWDAFGLPAEQYAIKNGVHPAVTTKKNIETFRRQIQSLGLSYDWDREVDTTDPNYYKWTQWIFLQLFNSYFDPIDQKARPIAHLINELANENLTVAPDGSIHLNRAAEGMEAIAGEVRLERMWREISPDEQRDVIDGQRLAYMDEAPVNWCPALGTVLANEEVIDGKSEVGGYPVEKKPMRQWMLRITAYADRLLKDLDLLNWPESLKDMQRNWIGKSVGAEVDFEIIAPDPVNMTPSAKREIREDEAEGLEVTVFTTRPDTLYGATYLVLAPEHPLVDRIIAPSRRESVEAYRAVSASKSDRDRMADAKEKTGVFTGAYAVNPVNDEKIPVWISDYVLMGYGTGAIMAVPAHDERDFEFATKMELPIRAVVQASDDWLRERFAKMIKANVTPQMPAHFHSVEASGDSSEQISSEEAAKRLGKDPAQLLSQAQKSMEAAFLKPNVGDGPSSKLPLMYAAEPAAFGEAFTGEGISINSPLIDGLPTSEAKEKITLALDAEGVARRSVKFKLRDWLFSRQRYWGEPFPIVLDAAGNAYAIEESELPLTLPEMEDFKPTGTPEPPLSKAKTWLTVESDQGTFYRETNTMPQWAGSCWYYLRYIDPKDPNRFVDPEKEKYWMPVDLYVGGVEHAVLHLLYSRFWHKVMFDLGHVSTPEPFRRLINQGLILGEMEIYVFVTAAGKNVSLADVRDIDEEATSDGVRMIGKHKQTGESLVGRRIAEDQIEKVGEGYVLKADRSIRADARSFKMSKSRGNVVNPDQIVGDYGADTFRLYEMYLGPLEAQKPWNTRDIVGMSRFLSSVWRNLIGEDQSEPSGSAAGSSRKVADVTIPEPLDRQLNRTIKKVGEDIETLRFNTAIAELIKLNNEMGKEKLPTVPKSLAETFALLLAPFAPHIAEEIWQRMGHSESLARHPWPKCDASKLVESTMDLPVQVNGKLRDKITVAADASEASILETAARAEKARPWIEGKEIVKKLYVPKKLVNFVVK